ncbi:MAG TPA: efflux transporter outer membrane subunit [Candidatus Binatia bacterium]|jgi:NodT family efflux transporter outer membrane factor (OMF) lipoprotein
MLSKGLVKPLFEKEGHGEIYSKNFWPLLIGVIAMTLAGCFAVGPDYKRPDLSAPAEWSRSLQAGVTAATPDAEALAQWWRALGDPDLSDLIERAAAGNLDLKTAQARVREARARRGVAQAGFFPTLNAGGSATRSRGSEQIGSGESRELYRLGFDSSWELDIFGRVRRSVEAAQGDLEASEADYQDVLVTLVAEVALNYVDARTLQSQLQVAEENLKTQQETLQLTQWRFEAGLVSRLDVEQARTNLESTRAQLPNLRSAIEEAKNRLAVLLGAFPGALEPQLGPRRPIPEAPMEVAIGVPAETLRRRPDVRVAERQLAAQTARIGVATADLYPTFSLPGSIGLEALTTHDFLNTANRAWSIAGNFAWPIFRGGAIRENIEVQNALQEQALDQYENTLRTALEEVENALVNYGEEQLRRQALAEATDAAQKSAELARNQYASGLIDFQSVLDAERSLLTSQDQLAQSRGQVTSNLISLYKALGGGWTAMTGGQP